MKWQCFEPSDELIGMHVLVKGYNRNLDRWFYAIGYIEKYGDKFALLREEDMVRGFVDSVRFFSRTLSYWYINIDEIK